MMVVLISVSIVVMVLVFSCGDINWLNIVVILGLVINSVIRNMLVIIKMR